MAQYRNGYAFFTNGSNIVTSSGGAVWNDSIIDSGSSVITLEKNVGYYFINSVEGPLYEEPYIEGNASGCYKLHLSAPYEVGTLTSNTGYLRYAITNSFTPNLGLPIIEKGDINTAAIFSAALYKLDQVYHSIQLTGAAYVDPLLEILQTEFENADQNLLDLINQLSGNLIDENSQLYLDNINESGQYLLDYIDTLVNSFSGDLGSRVSFLNSRYNNLSVGITGLSSRILSLENSVFDSGELSETLYSYCDTQINLLSGDLELFIYNQLQNISGDGGSGSYLTDYRLDILEEWQSEIINENYSYQISSNSGILSQKIISTGQYLYGYISSLSGTVNGILNSLNITYGTNNESFYIGNSISNRTLLKNTSGTLEIKNGLDSAYQNIELNSIYLNNYIEFLDGTNFHEENNYLYFEDEILATRNWTTGSFAIYSTLEERISTLEQNSEYYFKYTFSTYGETTYFIPFGKTYDEIPNVFTQLYCNGSDPVIAFYLHSMTTSSFYITFASAIPTSNYSLGVLIK
jgi:hypothetical protein